MTELGAIGPYRVISELGSGGMGVTYVAQRIGRSQLSALKHMHRRDEESSSEWNARFAREVRVAQMLVHPSIARLEDSDLDADEPYLTMELVPGVPVAALYARHRALGVPLPLEVALYVSARLFSALGYMHRFELDGRPSPVIHRDISAANVMLGFDGTVKLIDFGLSRFLESSTRVTKAGPAATVDYMPPEGPTPPLPSYDVFSASVLAYDILSNGRSDLFGSDELKREDARAATELGKLPRLDTLVPAVGPEISAVIAKGMAPRRDDRWQDCGELERAFVAATRGAPQRRAELAAMLRSQFPKQLMRCHLWQVSAQAFQAGLTHDRAEGDPAHVTAVGPSPMGARESGTEVVARRRGAAELINVDEVLNALDLPMPASATVAPATATREQRGMGWMTPVLVLLALCVAALTIARIREDGQAGSAALPSLGPSVVLASPRASPSPRTEVPEPTEAATSLVPSPSTTRSPSPSSRPSASPSPERPAVGAPEQAELLRLLGRLERSYVQPISEDPAFEPFLAEARRLAAKLPPDRFGTADVQLRLFGAEPSLHRAQKLAKVLSGQ